LKRLSFAYSEKRLITLKKVISLLRCHNFAMRNLFFVAEIDNTRLSMKTRQNKFQLL